VNANAIYIVKKLETNLPDKVYEFPINIGTEWTYSFVSRYHYGQPVPRTNVPYRYLDEIEGTMKIKVLSQIMLSTNAVYQAETSFTGITTSRKGTLESTTTTSVMYQGKCLFVVGREEVKIENLTFPNPNLEGVFSLVIPLKVRGDAGETIQFSSGLILRNKVGVIDYCYGWSRNYAQEAMGICISYVSRVN
jgi:hypothetical protein